MNTMPVSIRRASRLPRGMSLVNTEPPKPKFRVVGQRDGLFIVLDLEEERHRPEKLLRKAELSGLIFVRIVASMKEPGRSMRFPP